MQRQHVVLHALNQRVHAGMHIVAIDIRLLCAQVLQASPARAAGDQESVGAFVGDCHNAVIVSDYVCEFSWLQHLHGAAHSILADLMNTLVPFSRQLETQMLRRSI